MPTKQTPSTVNWPLWQKNGHSFVAALTRHLQELLRKLRNDLDNGATTFEQETIDGIANADAGDFDNGQIRLYTDSDDGDKVYLVSRVGDALKKVELT